jgi:hypothetical protein
MKVISGEPICNSPLNHSKSKYMYSFGKARRFPPIDRSYVGQFFYNLPSMKMKRSTSIGYGTKYDFTRDAKSKSPVFYNFKSDFDQKNPNGPKYSFGLGRECMYKTYDYSGPGPAKYNILKPFGRDGIKYSMRIKYNRSSSMDNIGSPGPGAYQPVTKINPNGTYFISKNENVHPVEFSKDKSQRFNYHYEITPGPSDYKKGSMFGRIFDSKFRSTNGISMRPKLKVLDSRDCYPGPGAYKFFSEFGIYEKDDRKNNKSRNSIKNKIIISSRDINTEDKNKIEEEA